VEGAACLECGCRRDARSRPEGIRRQWLLEARGHLGSLRVRDPAMSMYTPWQVPPSTQFPPYGKVLQTVEGMCAKPSVQCWTVLRAEVFCDS
jgi:hypothetical protein